MKAYSAILVYVFIACAFADDGPSSLCAKPSDAILESVVPWPTHKTPVKDDLDQFMIDKTGCAYTPLSSGALHYKVKRTYNGSPLELNFAVRGFYMEIAVSWKTPFHLVKYYLLGPQGVSQTNSLDFNSHSAEWTPKQEQSTPDIIDEDKYTPFYIKIDASTMKFGKICDTKPSFQPFTRDISINNNEEVEIQFVPRSNAGYGAALIVC